MNRDGEKKLLREFVLTFDQRFGEHLSRRTEWVRLYDRPELPAEDVNRWACDYGSDVLSFHYNAGERASRELFARKVVELRKREREARDDGLHVEPLFTVGTFTRDAV